MRAERVERGRLQSAWVRYSFGVLMVALALGTKVLVSPLTGWGAPYVLFFAAMLVTSLFAGTGPGILVLLICMPLGAYLFVVRSGTPASEAFSQAFLFLLDGVVILYLTALTRKRRETLDTANHELSVLRDDAETAINRTREVIELAPDAYFLADLDARFTDANQAACRMLNYRRDELVGKTIFDIIPPEAASRLKVVRDQLLVPGATHQAEWELVGANGSLVPVEVSANILADGRWQAFIRDITERKHIEDQRKLLLAREQEARRQTELTNAQLRESEERFRLTIDGAPIGMALVEFDGHFVRVNRALCEITGYSADELTALRFQDITHPDDLDKDLTIAKRLAGGEIPRYQFEKRYIRKDKKTVDVLLSVSTLHRDGEARSYFITQVEDITERKRAEHALRLSEAKFSGIVSIAADAIISVDPEQRITIFNAGAEKIFGYRAADVIGSQLERLIPERFRSAHREHFAAFVASDEAARTMGTRRDIFGLRKDGHEFPAEGSISKIAVGDQRFFSVVLRDITERKQVEAALQRAVSARDDMLRIVAHDLRNPLSAIMMQASAMERPWGEPERRDPQPRQVIMHAATRMNQLIQDLLDVALAETGRLRISPKRISASDLVRDAVAMEEPIAAAAEQTIRFHIQEGVGDMWGDRQRLLQVFENLIGNAIKFSKAGGSIVVSAAMQQDEVRFSVSDTGAGMAPETAERVFDRFWHAAGVKRAGAGLGLAIVKGIVEAHGGRVWLDTDLGRGSTFFFTIPVSPRQPPSAGPTRSREGGRRSRDRSARAKR